MDEQQRHARAARQAAAPKVAAVDPAGVIAVVDDAEKLVGWKQLTVPQRAGAIATLLTAASGLVVAIVTAVS